MHSASGKCDHRDLAWSLWFFRSVEQFPQSGYQKQAAEKLFQQSGIQLCTEPGKERRGNTAAENSWQYRFPGKAALFPAEAAGNEDRRNKKQQIDPPGGFRRDLQNNGKPQYQQTAAADTDAGQKAKHCGQQKRKRQGF